MGMAVVSLVFLGSVWAGENKAMIKDFKRQNPTLFVMAVMVASYFLMSLFDGVMVFMFGITFPILCKFNGLVLNVSLSYTTIMPLVNK